MYTCYLKSPLCLFVSDELICVFLDSLDSTLFRQRFHNSATRAIHLYVEFLCHFITAYQRSNKGYTSYVLICAIFRPVPVLLSQRKRGTVFFYYLHWWIRGRMKPKLSHRQPGGISVLCEWGYWFNSKLTRKFFSCFPADPINFAMFLSIFLKGEFLYMCVYIYIYIYIYI